MTIIKQGKKKRSELQLPILHFIVADDWLDKLGESFNVWLKLHTFVDRTDAEREYDKVPMSLERLYEKLKLSKSKFYRIIKPLWEYGLIDIIEYEESERKSQKPKNIIVYEYPFHVVEKKYLPLEKLRDWGKDYNSTSKIAGMTGGRPRKIETTDSTEEQPPKKDGFKNETVENDDNFNGFKNETVVNDDLDGFKNETVDGFKNETVTVSELKPNNVSNNSSNAPNSFNNVSYKSSSSKENEEEEDNINNIFWRFLRDYCFQNHFCDTDYQFEQIKKRLVEKGVTEFSSAQVKSAHNKTMDQIYNIGNVDQPHLYFATVLENEVVNGRLNAIKANQIEQQKIEAAEIRKRVPRVEFYNWLEQREERG